MIITLVEETVQAGARQDSACRELGISARMLQRWRRSGMQEDQRHGPRTEPKNKLAEREEAEIMRVVNSPEFRDLPPGQIVPTLSDKGIYMASESTIYRLLKKTKQLKHRQSSKPRTKRKVESHVACAPLQVWSWDITYLRTCVRGQFYYLYLIMDVWSRKIVAHCVEDVENMEISSLLIASACEKLGIKKKTLVLHSDNGSPMKGATMLATLKQLGVAPSFSRPHVSNDNPFSESLFGTMKGRPLYPQQVFKSIQEARDWTEEFVRWYNHEHLHSAINFVTPENRHTGQDVEILRKRDLVYKKACKKHPKRWTGHTRNWSHLKIVNLNPNKNNENHNGRKEVA